MKSRDVKETPLMRQYNDIKSKHPDAILLFRVGDFYETFGSDAILSSKILGIVLTKRSNGAASHVELAGFPHHSLETYLPKLVKAGCRVAVCDQLEDPKKSKGIVKRGITELVTPGVSLNDAVLNSSQNNFLASIQKNGDVFGVSFLDISTGEFLLTDCDFNELEKLLNTYSPSEILCSKRDKNFIEDKLFNLNFFYIDDWVYKAGYAYDKLLSFFRVKNLRGFGIDSEQNGIVSAGAILFYLELTEHNNLSNITSISRIDSSMYMWLDKFTIKNLELVSPLHENSKTLKDSIDFTKTPMGSRLISRWILSPLLDKSKIRKRQNFVGSFLENNKLRKSVSLTLSEISDIERISSKVAHRRVMPKELNSLKNSLINVSEIKLQIKHMGSKNLKDWASEIKPFGNIIQFIDDSINVDASTSISSGNVIKEKFNEELDELRNIASSGKRILLEIQRNEIKKTKISSLKVAYNKVFGYYLEVTNAHKDKVPKSWIRKQTLVSSERYITEELKQHEEKILNAEEKILYLENKLYEEVIETLSKEINILQEVSVSIAFIDCIISFADLASSSNFSKPEINDSNVIDIKKGRHLIIESSLDHDEVYIPNDIFLDNRSQQIIIITGPNMSGKSAIIRQVALIVLLAQIGSYVPSKSSKIGIVDKIFTRVGASDNISRGESTFMVEMIETSSIMNNLTDRSLVLMDEIGRGTSTYDGISIAWSIVEYLHNQRSNRPKTLFATHYHELNQISKKLDRVKNFNVSVKEINNEIIFLRKLMPGGSEHSFGINVAQLAGMPNEILIRAYEILSHLESNNLQKNAKKQLRIPLGLKNERINRKELDEIKKIIKKIDINNINPVQALVKLNEIIQIINSK